MDSEVLELKPFTIDDANAHLASEDAEQIRWLGEGKKSTLESVQNWIRRSRQNWESDTSPYVFAIWQKTENVLVGMIEANANCADIQGLSDGDVNLSYVIYPEYRGRGYATKAIQGIFPFLKHKNYRRAILRIDTENIHSLKIPIQSGFRNTGNVIETSKGKLVLFEKEI